MWGQGLLKKAVCIVLIVVQTMLLVGFSHITANGVDHSSMPCCFSSADPLSIHLTLNMASAGTVATADATEKLLAFNNGAACAGQLACSNCATGSCGSFISVSPLQMMAAPSRFLGIAPLQIFQDFYPLTDKKPPRSSSRSV